MSGSAERELRAEVYVAAPVERVWAVVTDLDRMPEWSPELVRMIPLGRGPGTRLGRLYVGVNRRKGVVWPTRNRIATFEPGRELAWDTLDSGARWIYELAAAGEGTRLVERRPVPRRLTGVGRLLARVALGGVDGHADELEAGMHTTLENIKAAAER